MKIKKLTTLLSFTIFSLSLISMPVPAAITHPASLTTSIEESITPCSDTLVWQYQVFDGKLYKRLFNTTTGNWVGDWIYVSDVN